MKKNFWKGLSKPFICLAPMADVTDAPFRSIIAAIGKPDVLFTQFVSCDGLCSPGKKNLLYDLIYDNNERPIVVQFFGKNPDTFYQCAQLANDLGFDGIDINMGCPDRTIMKQGAGASLIKSPSLVKEIISATKKGAGDLPVSVKTRIGDTKNEIATWVPTLLATGIDALTMHARTRKEMSRVPAKWEYIKDTVAHARNVDTVIIGNGDIANTVDAQKMCNDTGADGAMLGRAIFGNPWLFKKGTARVTQKERLLTLIKHTKLFEEILGDIKNFAVMKKHFKAYISDFTGAKELRIELMKVSGAKDVEIQLKKYIENHL